MSGTTAGGSVAHLLMKDPPDVFVWSIQDWPLHLKPWSASGESPATTTVEQERQLQKRSRDFFRYLRTAEAQHAIGHDSIMSNGESVGAASMWYINHQHEKRVKSQGPGFTLSAK